MHVDYMQDVSLGPDYLSLLKRIKQFILREFHDVLDYDLHGSYQAAVSVVIRVTCLIIPSV